MMEHRSSSSYWWMQPALNAAVIAAGVVGVAYVTRADVMRHENEIQSHRLDIATLKEWRAEEREFNRALDRWMKQTDRLLTRIENKVVNGPDPNTKP